MTRPAVGVDAERIGAARSMLFVPGDRPERIGTALAAGADAVIVDLEDAVRPARRPAARAHVAALRTRTSPTPLLVRVNPVGSPDFPADARAALAGRAAAIMVAKFDPAQGPALDAELAGLRAAADAEAGRAADAAARASTAQVCADPATGPGQHGGAGSALPVIALVETAAGMLRLGAGAPLPARVIRLAFGAVDLHADLGVGYRPDGTHTDLAMATLVWASAAAGLAAPLDSPHISLDDESGLLARASRAAALGFGGKLCIHPRQIHAVHRAFAVDAAQRAWAADVLACWEHPANREAGAVTLQGRLVDEAMVRRARRIAACPSVTAQPEE